jgi:glycosyltransferase involved in cell wall biosynthesis
VVLYVANLYREKGIFDLLHAFRRVVTRFAGTRPVRLLVGGKGREEEAVRALITRLGLADHAQLIGSNPYAAMPAIHALADVFVLPSIPVPTWQEQFGYVLAESMACGKPVVSTLSGSIPEVVGEAGRLVPPNDVLSLATALEELLLDDAERARLGAVGRQRAESLLSVGKASSDLRSHYRSLLHGAR